MEEKLLTDKDPVAMAQAARLRYVTPDKPGYTRVREGKAFSYLNAKGEKITDEAVIDRIKKLVLPPAWENVWICPYPNGHLQATGIDSLGRKQYRYHTRWAMMRNENKYGRLLKFGKTLPKIRARIKKDINRRQLDKDRVCAIALRIMEETLMRVGNAEYEKKYHSYGLTTLLNKHVKISNNEAFFKFKGKKGVMHQISLRQASLARLLKKVRDIPGQELFQYYENGEVKSLDSGELNDYLKSCTNEEFTCKDFRTWAGTMEALHLLSACGPFESQTACKKQVVEVIDNVAKKLGNTRAVCKKYYVHPVILTLYEEDKLGKYLSGNVDEKQLLHILRDHQQQK